ncbi:hypothetical protein IQ259_13165 [Fortiea sp. LEGE XX443]|uniref:hypothetical protein n=1 Tax=Fortiea sp. LEGE XX443 TaxID=1828611 RepID=UPI0018804F68|nr:hypothetical protein [Fortiea sp. LEGE XX443]MBE9005973.1 hypothetical protein [Fortiea sp. LEGE XX443]
MKFSTLTASFLTIASVILAAGMASAQPDANKKSLDAGFTASPTHGRVITTSINSYMSRSNISNSHVVKPFNLVYLAYQGNLKSQGIPGGSTLILQHQRGNLKAKDLVKAAINANQIPDQILQDQVYLSAVDVQLTSFQNRFLP